MAYKVMVETEDGSTYSTGEVFDSMDDAQAEADEIMTGDRGNRAYIDGSQICGVWVEKN